MSNRRICVVLTTRGNYAKMKSTMQALSRYEDIDLQVVIGGALLDQDYGQFEDLIRQDGFSVDDRLDYIQGEETLENIGFSSGVCTIEMTKILKRLDPDILMVIADRYECLSIAQAALCLNITIAHLEGGEVSGSIDERIRHAISKLAHIHFPANEDAADRIRRMGEADDSIHLCGTPSLDQIADMDFGEKADLAAYLKENGDGSPVDLDQKFLVVSQHPVVTEYDVAKQQFDETAKAVLELACPTIWILPNDDGGSYAAKQTLTDLLAHADAPPLMTLGGMPLIPYLKLLRTSSCLIGNTSSGIRECAFLGVPVVNVGTRQMDRQRGANVIDVACDSDAIVRAAKEQIDHGPYQCDPLYGDGHSGEKIARVLRSADPELNKRITY